jgi:hypothetical protein
MNAFAILSFLLLVNLPALSQEEEKTLYRNEVHLGFGYAYGFETNATRVGGLEDKIGGAIAVNLGFRYNFSTHLALGMSLYGYSKTLPPVQVTENNGMTASREFTVESMNIGLQGIWFFSRGTLQPYILVMMSWASATLSNDALGTLRANGFSTGGGLGTRVLLSEVLALSLEALGSAGKATWKQRPFLNSTGNTLDPSMIGVTVNLVYLWSD